MSATGVDCPKPLVAVCELTKIGITKDVQQKLEEWFTIVSFRQLSTVAQDQISLVKGAMFYSLLYDMYADTLARMTSLEAIVFPGIGYDKFPVKLFRDRGVKLANSPSQQGQSSVADFTMLLYLALSRQLVRAMEHVRLAHTTRVELYTIPAIGEDITNKTMGIIGMGGIGVQVAKRAQAFNMSILYHNRSPSKFAQNIKALYCENIRDLLRQSDVVVITCSLNDQSRGLIGKDELDAMKPTAVLINVARGEIVDCDALVSALQNGVICGAALDVTDPEPLPSGHPLLSLSNVLVTPHSAMMTTQACDDKWNIAFRNMKAALIDGTDMPNLLP